MTRTISLSVLVVALLLAWQSYAVWSMLQTCSAKARAIIAAADPLDREPPPHVASFIDRNLTLERLIDYLSTTLLERYACRGGPKWRGTDWLIDKPSLAWHLRATFSKSEITALFATTADMGKGDHGLSRGAKTLYNTDLSRLDDDALNCLVNKPFGKHITPSSEGRFYGYSSCPSDLPPPSPYVN